MALEAVVYPPAEPFSTYGYNRDFYGSAPPPAYNELCFHEDEKVLVGIFDKDNNNDDSINNTDLHPSVMRHANDQCHEWDPYSSPEVCTADLSVFQPVDASLQTATSSSGGRRKRRRTRSSKNKEELENQRMTHITVERNRRKQMNEYLAALRSLMPPSYVQRGDQASIIGGAINFVKELEQLLQSMEARKRTSAPLQEPEPSSHINTRRSPFAEFFSFPQYSTSPVTSNPAANEPVTAESVADIEVTMVESHANLKILSKKRPRQLLRLVAGLQSLRLSILHLNVTTTADQIVLYSISVKVEEGSHLNTVDEIAAGVNEMLRRIEEEACLLRGRVA